MLLHTVLTLFLFCLGTASAFPHAVRETELGMGRRQDTGAPDFPSDPPSCPLCAQGYAGIDSCAQAAPVFANVSMILFNPGAFVDVIRCACTDTFQSTYPQCVDCFTRTNQTQYLGTDDAPAVVSGIRSGCALLSAFIGNAPSADGEIPSSTSVVPTPTASTSSDAAPTSDPTTGSGSDTPSTGGATVLVPSFAVAFASLAFALAGLF